MQRFELPCGLSKKEAAAIERRRRLEEERKARIFDPKTRTLGVDKYALERQVEEKRAREELERCRNMQYDLQRTKNAQLASQLAEKIANMRRQINQDIDNYRISYQRPETRREYDLYDPSGLRKELPCRVADDDPRCGPSSAQKFAGEDLKGKERLATQREQQRAWLRQQLAERQTAEEERHRAERALQEAIISQDRHASCKQQVQEECRRKVQQATLDFNKALAAEQEARRRAEEAMEEEDKRMEVFNLMTGDFLTENPAVAVSSLGPHRLIPDRWKGMSTQQTEEIRLEQLRQAQQKQMEKEAEAKRQQDWENYILNCDEQALKAEHDLFEKRRQLNEHMAQYNKLLAEQQNVHRDYIERVVYSNEASKEYFDQFNTTTR